MPYGEGRKRVVIQDVTPEIDGGRFAIKRAVGEKVLVGAFIFANGHDSVSAGLLYKRDGEKGWKEIRMTFAGNDSCRGEFIVDGVGIYFYTIEGWVDYFKTWQKDIKKKFDTAQDIKIDLLTGVEYIDGASERASGPDKKKFEELGNFLRGNTEDAILVALGDELSELMDKYPNKRFATTYGKELRVVVERERVIFSAWYERFPRSCSPEPGRHGTFKDCEAILSEISRMGFDILYLPPIHPIGKTNRKGKNNSSVTGPNDEGSPWAIGSDEGGHKAIHPKLGTFEDFENLVIKAKDFGIEVALDLAFQCSPDHPYVKEHPKWFKWGPDGTIRYAENPPKKYEDIFPLNFETAEWQELWEELKSIVVFWVKRGVRIFRVDNPHTKPFPFWEWLMGEIKRDYPDVIFLSEAFTKPSVMYYLAKLGFTQSYTYFTWRNTKREFTDYLVELTQTDTREYFRPNFWPNTPDILAGPLQNGGRHVFMMRLVLASTLSSNYGIYGPAFELCVNEPMPGNEEYQNSEKYEIKNWDWNRPGNLKDFIARINRIRKENPALQTTWNLKFYEADNDHLLFYGKWTEDLSNIILVVVNLNTLYTQSGWVKVPIWELGMDSNQSYVVHDLLNDEKYIWYGERNYVELNPQKIPAHILRVEKG
jgi:starch synthase (maltosyl-transferring)